MATNATPAPSAVVTTQESNPIPKTLVEPKSKAVDFAGFQVKIKVGVPPTIYYAHRQLLCDSSEFFRAALGPRWVEGKTGVINMPEDDAEAFNIYLNWLHKAVLPIDFDEEHDSPVWRSIVRAYALGDKLLDVSFKDATTDAIACIMSTTRPGDKIFAMGFGPLTLSHERLARDSKLNLLLAHKYARYDNASDLIYESQPAGFLLNVTLELLRSAKENPPETTDAAVARCAFHEHAPGAENCYRSKRG